MKNPDLRAVKLRVLSATKLILTKSHSNNKLKRSAATNAVIAFSDLNSTKKNTPIIILSARKTSLSAKLNLMYPLLSNSQNKQMLSAS